MERPFDLQEISHQEYNSLCERRNIRKDQEEYLLGEQKKYFRIKNRITCSLEELFNLNDEHQFTRCLWAFDRPILDAREMTSEVPEYYLKEILAKEEDLKKIRIEMENHSKRLRDIFEFHNYSPLWQLQTIYIKRKNYSFYDFTPNINELLKSPALAGIFQA